MEDYIIFWLWLANIKGIGPVYAKILLDHFIEPEHIFRADIEQLYSVKDLGRTKADLIMKSKSLKIAEEILGQCKKLNINILTNNDFLYPEDVRKIHNTPILLYYRGKLIENSMGVAIVGARRCTEYGKHVTQEATEFLAKHNIPVISGMAKGIDSYANTACLNKDGYTIAFLGCGADICYPKEHSELMKRIIEKGVVISEYPPGATPKACYFPERNRLISAWCRKILVVEAGEDSGALLTAHIAVLQKKEVYAVPNNIYQNESKGTNRLIQKGAFIYLEPQQLLLEGFHVITTAIANENLEVSSNYNSLERSIIDIIKNKPSTIDEIMQILKHSKIELLEQIAFMEIEGKLKSLPGGKLTV